MVCNPMVLQKLAMDLEIDIEFHSYYNNDISLLTVTKKHCHKYMSVYRVYNNKKYTEEDIINIVMSMAKNLTKKEEDDRIAYNEIKDVLQKSSINNSKNDMEENSD